MCMVLSSNTYAQAIDNQEVIKLVQSGLPESVIIKKLKTSPTNFNLSTEGLVELTSSDVPESVMNAMLEIGETEVDEHAEIAALMPKPGIYLIEGEGSNSLEHIATGSSYNYMEPTPISKVKEGGVGSKMARSLSIAGKNKIRAVLLGDEANQITSTKPEFYFYFGSPEQQDAAASQSTQSDDPNAAMMAQLMAMSGQGSRAKFTDFDNPNQFHLVKMDVKKGEREFIASQYSGAGSESGIDGDDVIQFKYIEIRPNLYHVFVEDRLERGEYVFVGAGIPIGQGTPVIDFSAQ